MGTTADVDPANAWKDVDGKLYLNTHQAVQKKWERDMAAMVATADRNWPCVLD